jgi:hypothetical protein
MQRGVEVLLTTSDGAAEHQRAPSSASTMLLQVEFGFVPEGISVQHLERLLGGLLLATSPRVERTKLLRRTYEIYVLACSRCGERMRLMAAITDKAGFPSPQRRRGGAVFDRRVCSNQRARSAPGRSGATRARTSSAGP